MSRAGTHPTVMELFLGSDAPPGVKGQFFNDSFDASRLESAAKALHDLPLCLLTTKGDLRRDTMLLDETGSFIYDNWQEAAKLIADGIRQDMKSSGHKPETIDPKHMTYLIARRMIMIEQGSDKYPQGQSKSGTKPTVGDEIRQLLKVRSFIDAVNDQDKSYKLEQASKGQQAQAEETQFEGVKSMLPLYEKVKAAVIADSGRSEDSIDPQILSHAVEQALNKQLADARRSGTKLAEAFADRGMFAEIDKRALEQYFSILAVENIGGADQGEIKHREHLKAGYPDLPADLNTANALLKGPDLAKPGAATQGIVHEGRTAENQRGRAD